MINGTYQMSGKTGSLRYMAPEVALEQPYNETCDVYSLAIMAWQIFAMNTPFSGYSMAMHNDLVVQKGYRPKLEPGKWGDNLCNVMTRSWSKNINDRPKMKEVTKLLREEVNKHEDEIEDFGQIDASSRTNNSV
jgi:serine/threonine protein kinase